jgi:predicted Zn-dependent peptidase
LIEAQPKETPPEGGAPKAFHAPKREDFVLPNGLRVSMTQYGLIPKIAVELVLNGGDITELNDHQGAGNLLGEMLKEGTAARSAQQVATEAAGVGGDITVQVGPDQIVLHGEALSDGAPQIIALLADVALHPKLPESELARVKKDMLRKIAILRSTPRVMATKVFLKSVYGDNGYGRAVPNEASIEKLTITDLKEYYTRHFVPENAKLYISGVFTPGLQNTVKSAFGDWAKGKAPEIPDIKAKTVPELTVVDRPGAAQSTIYMGLPVTTPGTKDYVPLEVTDSILGGSFMSRITSNIREQKGYTYSPKSSLETNAENSIWAEHADVTTKVTGASLKEIYSEIDRLRKEAPPEKELKAIQNGMAGVFVLRNSSRQGIINLLKFVDLHKLPGNYLDSYIANVYRVKPADVQGTMEKYIDPKKMTVVVVGDKKEIESQVAPFKPGQ